jgi:hypothetical protein
MAVVHEVERMIRLALKYGPQRGLDVRVWTADATGYSDRKVYEVAEGMARRGDLRRGLWALRKSALTDLLVEGLSRENLIDRFGSRQEPRATTSECSQESSLDEWRDLMGDESIYEAD